MSLLTFGSSRLQVTEAPKAPFKLVFVHGAAARGKGFRPFIHHLKSFSPYPLQIEIIDLPGHGFANSQPPRSTLEHYATDVIEILQQRQRSSQSTILVGHSMGGAISQIVGLKRPDLLSGMIIIASTHAFDIPSEFLKLIQNDFLSFLKASEQFLFAQNTPNSWRHAFLKNFLPNPSQEVVYADFFACSQFDQRNLSPLIETPALVIAGEHDALIPPKFSKMLAEELPLSCYKVVRNTGHLVFLEAPGQVSKLCLDFLGRLAQRATS
ncbi:MAG: alpha/beta hydrolase [Planctomycetota bacterium]|nr:alpha/beta hydrolase [Planctomycetota bacterium]